MVTRTALVLLGIPAAYLWRPLNLNVRRRKYNFTSMRFIFMFIVTTALLSACSRSNDSSPPVPRNSALVEALQGNWCVTDDEGKTCWGYDTFLNGDTILACGVIPETEKNFRGKASFKVSGDSACYEITESNDTTSFPVGLKFCTQVLSIDDKSQRYKYLDTGETITTYRVPAASVKCPSEA